MSFYNLPHSLDALLDIDHVSNYYSDHVLFTIRDSEHVRIILQYIALDNVNVDAILNF